MCKYIEKLHQTFVFALGQDYFESFEVHTNNQKDQGQNSTNLFISLNDKNNFVKKIRQMMMSVKNKTNVELAMTTGGRI